MGRKIVRKKDGSRVVLQDGRITNHLPSASPKVPTVNMVGKPDSSNSASVENPDYGSMLDVLRKKTPISNVQVREENETGVTIVYAEVDGKEVGWLQLNFPGSDGGRVVRNVEVLEEYRRQGIATKLWEQAVSLGLNPKHDERRTAAGEAWATSVGSDKPENIVAQWHDYEYQDMRGKKHASGTLSSARFSQTIFDNETLSRLNVEGSDFNDASMRKVKFTGATLNACSLVGTDCTEATGYRASFVNTTIDRAKFLRTRFVSVNMEKVAGVRADFSDSDLAYGTFKESNFEGANFKNAILRVTHWENVNLTGVNFFGADFNGATMSNITYDDSTLWPSGFRPPPSM